MKNVIIITGPRASGKTTLLHEMAKGRNACRISEDELRDGSKKITIDTEIIVIDECTFSKRNIQSIKALITSSKLTVRSVFGRHHYSVDRPLTVIASNASPRFPKRKHIINIRLR